SLAALAFIKCKAQATALDKGRRRKQDHALVAQALANTLQIVIRPKRQITLQTVFMQFEPSVTPLMLHKSGTVLRQLVEHSQHGRFFKTNGGGEGRRNKNGFFRNQTRHGRESTVSARQSPEGASKRQLFFATGATSVGIPYPYRLTTTNQRLAIRG